MTKREKIKKTGMKKLILSVAVFIAAVNVYGQHKVTMRSGESMNGEVKSMANDEVSFLIFY